MGGHNPTVTILGGRGGGKSEGGCSGRGRLLQLRLLVRLLLLLGGQLLQRLLLQLLVLQLLLDLAQLLLLRRAGTFKSTTLANNNVNLRGSNNARTML